MELHNPPTPKNNGVVLGQVLRTEGLVATVRIVGAMGLFPIEPAISTATNSTDSQQDYPPADSGRTAESAFTNHNPKEHAVMKTKTKVEVMEVHEETAGTPTKARLTLANWSLHP